MNKIHFVIIIGIISVTSIVGYVSITSSPSSYAIVESLKKSVLIKDKEESLQKSMLDAGINDNKGVNNDTLLQFKKAPELENWSSINR